MVEAVLRSLSFLPKELVITIIAALPVLELRGAIPIGLSMGVEVKRVMLFSIYRYAIILQVLIHTRDYLVILLSQFVVLQGLRPSKKHQGQNQHYQDQFKP